MREAIVVGAGIAGLLTAHVLARHGLQVTLLEQDPLPRKAAHRRGTPQDHHPHALLHRGAETLERLLPGLGADRQQAGGRIFEFGMHARVRFPGGWAPQVAAPVYYHALSRPELEHILRQRILTHTGIELVDGVRADRLTTDDYRAVTGIRDARGNLWSGDLVIDASGRGSRLTKQLNGSDRPRKVRAQMVYTTRAYRRTPACQPTWSLTAALTYSPDRRRGGVAVHVEHDKILVTLIGVDGEKAPTDDNGFQDYAAGLRNQDLLEVITCAEPAGPIRRYGPLDNLWHPHHRMRRWPEGLLVTGDAVCTLNPIYGHGMTVAALQAETLDRLLDQHYRRSLLTTKFRRAVPTTLRTPWQLAAYSDLGWSPLHAYSPPALVHRLVRHIVDRIPEDPELYRRFITVQNLTAHPAVLAAPLLHHPRTPKLLAPLAKP